jgi:8-oxo-dGTP diphosphatase
MRSDFGWAWESPGGKVKDGEGARVAMCREIGEELGVDSVVGDPIASFDLDPPLVSRPLRVTFYGIVHTAGHIEPLHAVGLGWFTVPEMAGLTMTPANEAFRAALADYVANMPEAM